MDTDVQTKHFQDITAEHILSQRQVNADTSKTFPFVLMKPLTEWNQKDSVKTYFRKSTELLN